MTGDFIMMNHHASHVAILTNQNYELNLYKPLTNQNSNLREPLELREKEKQ